MSADTIAIEAAALAALFPGNPAAHATADYTRAKVVNGKVVPKYATISRAATIDDYSNHLLGKRGLLSIPLNADGLCSWFAIDVDKYGISAAEIAQCVQRVGLPLVIARTKSDGWRLLGFFKEPEPIDKLQELGRDWAALLGFADAEVFPKQAKYEEGTKGNGINLPYFNAAATEQYGINDHGERLPLMAWIEHAKAKRTTLHTVRQLPFADGPPCLQAIAARKLREHEGRDNAFYQALVYTKLKYGADELEARGGDHNEALFIDPLSPAEVAKTVKSVGSHDNYHYKCHDVPCAALCNKELCRKREFGIGAAADSNAVFMPDNQTQPHEAAAEIYRRADELGLLFLRGGRAAAVVDDAIEIVRKQHMRSIIGRLGPTYEKVATRTGGIKYKRQLISADKAEAVLECADERRAFLREIMLVVKIPLIAPDGSYLQPGYNDGGVYVLGDGRVEHVEYDEAVRTLREQLLDDFNFAAPGDYARAFAMLVSPALRMAGLLRGPTPIFVTEANLSQTGKTLLQVVTRVIYRADVPLIARRKGGVGSYDESLATHYLRGYPFVVFDNVRGQLDSQYLEAAITAPAGLISVRVPNKPELGVDISRVTHQMTSNEMEMTTDLANRCCIMRIHKRPDGYEFKHANLEEYAREHQPFLLGCAYAVVRDWIARGKPQLSHAAGGHDFREWSRALGEIVQRAGLAAPLMEGHKEQQQRVANPALVWLQALVPLLEPFTVYRASGLYDCADACGIKLPGGEPENREDAFKRVGSLMKRAFKDANQVRVDKHHVLHRKQEEEARSDGKGMRDVQLYWREQTEEEAARDGRPEL